MVATRFAVDQTGPASLAVLAAAEGFFAGVSRFTGAAWLAVGFIGVNSGIGAVLLGEPVTAGAAVALVCVAPGLKLAVQ